MTNGHLDVIERASTLFDEVVVAVLYNPAKTGTFPVERRIELIQQALGSRPRVRVESFAGRLLVDVCQDLGAGAIVKGLRGSTDFAFELPMALMNRHLTGVETVFLPGNPAYELGWEMVGLGAGTRARPTNRVGKWWVRARALAVQRQARPLGGSALAAAPKAGRSRGSGA